MKARTRTALPQQCKHAELGRDRPAIPADNRADREKQLAEQLSESVAFAADKYRIDDEVQPVTVVGVFSRANAYRV